MRREAFPDSQQSHSQTLPRMGTCRCTLESSSLSRLTRKTSSSSHEGGLGDKSLPYNPHFFPLQPCKTECDGRQCWDEACQYRTFEMPTWRFQSFSQYLQVLFITDPATSLPTIGSLNPHSYEPPLWIDRSKVSHLTGAKRNHSLALTFVLADEIRTVTFKNSHSKVVIYLCDFYLASFGQTNHYQ